MDFNINRRSALKAGTALALAYGLPVRAQAKPTIRFAAVFSDKDIRADMIRMLAKDTEGDFKLEPFFGGTLFKQGTELVALQRDNLELGNIAPQDISKQIPAWSLLTSAYLFRDANHLMSFWQSDVGTQYKDHFELRKVRAQALRQPGGRIPQLEAVVESDEELQDNLLICSFSHWLISCTKSGWVFNESMSQ